MECHGRTQHLIDFSPNWAIPIFSYLSISSFSFEKKKIVHSSFILNCYLVNNILAAVILLLNQFLKLFGVTKSGLPRFFLMQLKSKLLEFKIDLSGFIIHSFSLPYHSPTHFPR